MNVDPATAARLLAAQAAKCPGRAVSTVNGAGRASVAATPAATPPKGRGMNKTEQAHALRLEMRRRAGEVAWYGYEAVKLRLADATWYTPDFAVLMADGAWTFHETKGAFIRDDARVKLKVAAEAFPFRFWLMVYNRGTWNDRAMPGAVDRIDEPRRHAAGEGRR